MFKRLFYLISLFTFPAIFSVQGQDFESLDLPPQHKALIEALPDEVKESISFAYEYPALKLMMKQLFKMSNELFPVIIVENVPFLTAQSDGLIFLNRKILKKHVKTQAYALAHIWHHAIYKAPNDYVPIEDNTNWYYRRLGSYYESTSDLFATRFLMKHGYGIKKVRAFLNNTKHAHKWGTGSTQFEYIAREKYRYKRKHRGNSTPLQPAESQKCTHLIQPSGHFDICSHPAHPYDGAAPNTQPFVHPQHTDGHIIPCTHYQHPYASCRR